MLDGLSEQPVRYSPDVRDLRQGSISEVVLGFVNTLLVDGRRLVTNDVARGTVLIAREFPTWEGGGVSRAPSVARLVL